MGRGRYVYQGERTRGCFERSWTRFSQLDTVVEEARGEDSFELINFFLQCYWIIYVQIVRVRLGLGFFMSSEAECVPDLQAYLK